MIENIENPGIIATSDWSRIRNLFSVAWNEIQAGKWENKKTYEPIMQATIYSMDKHGVICISEAENNTPWQFWNGPWLEQLLPWASIVRDQMSKAGLPIANISYHAHTDNIYPHKDIAYLGYGPDEKHTNINFMISSATPDDSYTWCRDDEGNEKRYYSHANKLWLLNASNLHAVVCKGLREGLIIKLRQPYEKVSAFFKSNPNFFNADQPYFKS